MLSSLLSAHARLKARIHGTRFIIHSRSGRFAMGCLYLTAPCCAGYFVMNWTNGIAKGNLGQDGEILKRTQLAARRGGGRE